MRKVDLPWWRTYWRIIARVKNPKCHLYKRYGGLGIENFLTADDLKMLWFRDKAYLLDKASIDRKDSRGNYTIENCRFIEHKINAGRPHKELTHCKRNHPYSGDNLKVKSYAGTPKRTCRECE